MASAAWSVARDYLPPPLLGTLAGGGGTPAEHAVRTAFDPACQAPPGCSPEEHRSHDEARAVAREGMVDVLWEVAAEQAEELCAAETEQFCRLRAAAGRDVAVPTDSTPLPGPVAFCALNDAALGERAAAMQRRLAAWEARAGTDAPELELDDVSFEYRSPSEQAGERAGNAVLRSVRLRVPAGQRLAQVGESGCGKSTVLRLLLREETLDGPGRGGVVRVGGVDVRSLPAQAVRRAVSHVAQDAELWSDTLLRNVQYGRPSAFREECMAAGSAAALSGTAAKLRRGWHSPVGLNGVKLSGGERQRVALARAMARMSLVLLLDEATSALDSETERIVKGALLAAEEARTCVVVAHRLATIASADRVVVLADGAVAEEGTHAELVARGGTCAALWSAQSVARDAAPFFGHGAARHATGIRPASP